MYIGIFHGSQRLRDYDGLCPPFQRRGGAGPGSPREKPNLHRQRESAVKCSHGSVLSVSPFSTILLQNDSLAKAHGHCLRDIAHFASAPCTSDCSSRCRPLPILEILYSVSDAPRRARPKVSSNLRGNRRPQRWRCMNLHPKEMHAFTFAAPLSAVRVPGGPNHENALGRVELGEEETRFQLNTAVHNSRRPVPLSY